MTNAADEGRDARGRATQGAVAEQWVTVATGLTEARANELALVLTARGVPFQRQPGSRGWELWVPLGEAPAAATELTLYRHENAGEVGTRPLEEVGEGRAGVLWYVATLLAVFFALYANLFDRDWLGAGRLEAGPLLDGEWWRAVTALTLHRELDHLGGNLAFGAFYGYFVGRYLGGGVGWLAVLLAASGAQRVERVGAVAGASRDRSVDGRVRRARTARDVYLAARLLARHAVARAYRADRRRPRPARVHGHGRREHRLGRALVRLHRGARGGSRDRAVRARRVA